MKELDNINELHKVEAIINQILEVLISYIVDDQVRKHYGYNMVIKQFK